LLAWAKTPGFLYVHACENQKFRNQRVNIFQATTTTEPYKHETKPKQAEYCKKHVNPSFPYLEKRGLQRKRALTRLTTTQQ